MLVHCAATYEKSDVSWATSNEDWMGLSNHDGSRKPTAQAFVDAIHAAGDNR